MILMAVVDEEIMRGFMPWFSPCGENNLEFVAHFDEDNYTNQWI